ncbi:MAG: hypothetical protein COB27_016120, partial [Moritella sp.]|nr:hypothetical protein [Moritella sp.]
MKSGIDNFIEMLISNKVNQVVRVAKAITEPLSQTAKGQYSQYYHQTASIRNEQYHFDSMDWGYAGIKQPIRPTMQPYNQWVGDKLTKAASYDYSDNHFFKTDNEGNTEVNEDAAFHSEFEFPTVHSERYSHLNDIVTNHTNNLAKAALANQSSRFRAELKELEAKFAPLLPKAIPTIKPQTPAVPDIPLFKDLLPEYLAYKKEHSSRDHSEHKRHMEIWSISFSDMRIDEINTPTIQDTWGVLSKLPKQNKTKGIENPFAGLSIQDRWTAATDDDIDIDPKCFYSYENAKKYRSELSTFLDWCVAINQCSTHNPLLNNHRYLYNFKERRKARTKFPNEVASK